MVPKMARYRGGYNVLMDGKPSADLVELPSADVLHLPLFSSRFSFSVVRVKDGDQVGQGQVLAEDADNYSVPLLAPGAGTVKLDEEGRHVTIENVKIARPEAGSGSYHTREEPTAALLRLGAWQFFSDACTGKLPDPSGKPKAVIISALRLDPFVVRGDVQLQGRVSEFARGLELLHSSAGDQPVYLIIPSIRSDLAGQVRGLADKYSWLTLVEVKLKYPFGNLQLAAQNLGFDRLHGKDMVWGLGVEGVMAVDGALTSSRSCASRTISIGGPGAKNPAHAIIPVGYPLTMIAESCSAGTPVRMVNGGALAGRSVPADQQGLDSECLGITLIPENTEREVLAFAHLGFGKHAFTNTFFSVLRGRFRERYTTAVRGEHRPCVACSSCERACPAGIMPFLVHRYVDKQRIEEAERFGLWKCIECGLCSHVCLAKRNMSSAFCEARENIEAASSPGVNQS